MKFFHLLLGFLSTRFIFFFYEEIRIYVRTRNKVKVGEKEGEWIETTNGVRQGCPLSPLMFTIYLCGRYTGLSQKWRTNSSLRCRRDYRKRQKNFKKILLDLFADLAVFESGT
jgi:hypothetical protein